MAVSHIPAEGIALHGIGNGLEDSKAGTSGAVTLKLSDSLVQDIKSASQVKDGFHFVTGTSPRLRIGGRTIDLSLSADAFRNELYASTIAGSIADLRFSRLITHRATLRQSDTKKERSEAGADAALAALRSSLASLEQEKQANQADIRNDVLQVPKNRFDAAKKHRRMLSGGFSPSSPNLSATPQHGQAPTSAPTSESEVRLKAMRTPLIHLLAIEPIVIGDIVSKTHIPTADLNALLQKIAENRDGKWQLGNKAYRELDIWNFEYTEADREAAKENAIKAYDRQRIGKDEKIWQNLLPLKDRGKGITLSRLHLSGPQVHRGLTPNYGQSPAPSDVGDSRPASAANTPRPGASPRPASSRGDMVKRLLSKDPKKARAVEEAKEKRRKEKEAAREAKESAASDREHAKVARRQPTVKKANPKIKSAEVVHSSDDESGEEGEVKEGITRVDSKFSPEKPRPTTAKAQPKPTSASPDSSDSTNELKKSGDSAKKKEAVDPAKSIASLATKAAKAPPGKATPRTTNGLSAPTSQHKSSRSPQKADSRPSVPSPLGAARPRVASDVSDRTAVGVQRAKQPGSGTSHGLGITNGVRKRQDTITSTASNSSSASDKKRSGETSSQKAQKPAVNGTGTPKTNGVARPVENGMKRKAEGAPSESQALKHRKTDSMSSQSQNSHSTYVQAQSTARTSPDASYDGGSSDSAASVLDTITFTQGVSLAEKFSRVYYPAYTTMYDAQAAKEARGETVSKDERERLWAMHRRLEQMKREIQIASQREHRED